MKGKRKGKIAADSLVILCGLIIAGYVIIELRDNRWFYPALVAAGAVMLVAGIDIYRLTVGRQIDGDANSELFF